jgi:hypothetical protein
MVVELLYKYLEASGWSKIQIVELITYSINLNTQNQMLGARRLRFRFRFHFRSLSLLVSGGGPILHSVSPRRIVGLRRELSSRVVEDCWESFRAHA